MMPLASATAINFSAPLFAALASAIFLKEAVGTARWVVLMVGFLGVLIVTNPGGDTFQIGALFALGNAVLFGTVTAGVRGMTSTESAKTLTMYQLVLLTTFYAHDAAVPVQDADLGRRAADHRQRRDQHARPVLVDAGAASRADLGGGAVPVFLADLGDDVRLLRCWGDVPTVGLLIGSVIVVGSGLFLLWHESRRRRPAVPPS